MTYIYMLYQCDVYHSNDSKFLLRVGTDINQLVRNFMKKENNNFWLSQEQINLLYETGETQWLDVNYIYERHIDSSSFR